MKLFGIYYGVWKESVSLSVSSQKKVEILKIIMIILFSGAKKCCFLKPGNAELVQNLPIELIDIYLLS